MVRQRLACSAAAAVLATLSFGLAADPTSQPARQAATAAKPVKKITPVPAISQRDGKLNYVTQSNGDRVPDYSYAGYMGGEKTIPTLPARLLVAAPTGGDDTRMIQAAIDQAGQLPADANGFRGAVLLPPGQYRITRQLNLNVSGVVLRGSGFGDKGTQIVADGTDRRTVINITGGTPSSYGDERNVTSDYVPVGGMQITLADAKGLAVGDRLAIRRPSTQEWIETLGMDDLGGDRHGPSWKAGSRDVVFERGVAKITGSTVTLDAPITLAIDKNFGGATVSKIEWPARVSNVGVENLRIVSTFDGKNPKDEEHAWFGVGINNASDSWVRRMTFEGLAGSAVAVWENASRVTVEDCKSLAPVSEIGGWRRYSFFTTGQQVLMQRLFSEGGYHDFAVGYAAAGPNAFVQCESVNSFGESGPIDSASCGTLFDRVRIDGQPLALRNRTYLGQGSGWASFNSTLWNSSAPLIECWQPPTAQNWAFGTTGEFAGNGVWAGSNDDVNPNSLYYAQLSDRIGIKKAGERAQLTLPPVQGSRAPTIESAQEAIDVSMKPRVDMSHWIDDLALREPIPTATDGVAKAQMPSDNALAALPPKLLSIKNGLLLIDGKLAVGGNLSAPWWNGSIRPGQYEKAPPAITRFVPGRTGHGLTDNLIQLADGMVSRGNVAFMQFPPLWYERRRDDHTRVQRIDGDVVAPFYETPWDRSGIGRASDGLSKFDVTKPNTWYYSRLRQFADLAAERGLLLFNGLYQQHNILEAGAHYADAPWRPANNINQVGIPEPVFFAGDKLIYVAAQFYDVTDPERAALHRTYMRNALNELADKPNVIFYLSEEYTGPLAFTQFWLDTIAEWKKETGKRPLIALHATKDVTDAILADPKRAEAVSMIYNSYDQGEAGFWYQPDGTLYAPEGGRNLSPRQWVRLRKPKGPTFDGVLKMVREYRTKYPDRPFVYTGSKDFAWAVVLGGGSLAGLPATTESTLLDALTTMKPFDGGLTNAQNDRIVYQEFGELSGIAPNTLREIDMKTGRLMSDPQPGKGKRLFWISRMH